MRRAWIVVALAGLFTVSGPRAADAWVWDWVDKLSGPGPFKLTPYSNRLEWRLLCFQAERETLQAEPERHARAAEVLRLLGSCASYRDGFNPRKERRASINIDIGYKHTERNNLTYAALEPDRDVDFLRVGGSLWWRPNRSVEIGAGGGVLRFRGPVFESFSRFFVEPLKVDIKPIALIKEAGGAKHWTDELVTIRAGHLIVPQGFEAADFGAVPGTFQTSSDVLLTFGFVFDLDPLWRHWKGQRY
jgi:hypothetical protein